MPMGSKASGGSGLDWGRIVARGATVTTFNATAAGLLSALQFLPSRGGVIEVPDVTIDSVDLSTPANWKNQVRLKGLSTEASRLNLSAGIDFSNPSAEFHWLEIDHLYINGGNGDFDIIGNPSQGDTFKAENISIHHCEIANAKHASGYNCINLKNHETSWIYYNYIHGASEACLKLSSYGAVGYYAGNIHVLYNMFGRDTTLDPLSKSLPQILLDTTGNNGKEIDVYNIVGNHFYGTGYVGQYGIVTNTLNGRVKFLRSIQNRCEGANLFKALDCTASVEYLLIAHCHIEQSNALDSVLLYQKDGTHGVRYAQIFDNHFGSTKPITDQNTEYAKPNSILQNWFDSGSTVATTRATVISQNQNFNPRGIIATPFNNTDHDIKIDGNAAGPTVASTDYVVRNCDVTLKSTGGTGVAIVIKDKAATTIHSPGATFTGLIRMNEIINFGAFTVAPTVVVAFN